MINILFTKKYHLYRVQQFRALEFGFPVSADFMDAISPYSAGADSYAIDDREFHRLLSAHCDFAVPQFGTLAYFHFYAEHMLPHDEDYFANIISLVDALYTLKIPTEQFVVATLIDDLLDAEMPIGPELLAQSKDLPDLKDINSAHEDVIREIGICLYDLELKIDKRAFIEKMLMQCAIYFHHKHYCVRCVLTNYINTNCYNERHTYRVTYEPAKLNSEYGIIKQ